eukprot:m.6382 g.6382  ORF g.6382 m.6382 type:complete len:136 (+) comp15708_c0_seq2:7-414(+)
MKVFVKHLQGKGVEIEIDEDTLLEDVKERLEGEMGVPCDSQKLVYKGKVLQSDISLVNQGLTAGCRLFLSGKPSQVKSKREAFTQGHLQPLMAFLRHYFSANDSEKIVEEFRKAIKSEVDAMSLDDIERVSLALS